MDSDAARNAPGGHDPKRGFTKRLGYYLLGIAIGLMLYGFFQQARTRALQQRAAQRQAAQQGADPQTPGGNPRSTSTPDDAPGPAEDAP